MLSSVASHQMKYRSLVEWTMPDENGTKRTGRLVVGLIVEDYRTKQEGIVCYRLACLQLMGYIIPHYVNGASAAPIYTGVAYDLVDEIGGLVIPNEKRELVERAVKICKDSEEYRLYSKVGPVYDTASVSSKDWSSERKYKKTVKFVDSVSRRVGIGIWLQIDTFNERIGKTIHRYKQAKIKTVVFKRGKDDEYFSEVKSQIKYFKEPIKIFGISCTAQAGPIFIPEEQTAEIQAAIEEIQSSNEYIIYRIKTLISRHIPDETASKDLESKPYIEGTTLDEEEENSDVEDLIEQDENERLQQFFESKEKQDREEEKKKDGKRWDDYFREAEEEEEYYSFCRDYGGYGGGFSVKNLPPPVKVETKLDRRKFRVRERKIVLSQ